MINYSKTLTRFSVVYDEIKSKEDREGNQWHDPTYQQHDGDAQQETDHRYPQVVVLEKQYK